MLATPLIAAILALPAGAVAQADPRPRLTLRIGGVQLAQSVPAISPSRYTGTGVFGGLGLERTTSASHGTLTLSLTQANLESGSTTNGAPADRASIASLEVTHVRRIGRLSSPAVNAFLGARLEAVVHVNDHRYGEPYTFVRDQFGYALATAALAARLDIRAGRGRLTEEMAVPLVGLAQFPYVNAKAERSSLRLRAVRFGEFYALDQRLGYRTPLGGGGWELVWSYHLALLRQSRFDSRRYARQGLSGSLGKPLGRRR